MKQYDVIALGELLIDFTPRGRSEKGNFLFEANPGGAPSNVLAQLARLGKRTAFVGKVGEDTFGYFLRDTLAGEGIDTRGLVTTPDHFTTLAFVTLDEEGNRNFAFARNNSADTALAAEEVDEELIESARIFHCGTLSLTHPAARGATQKALDVAKAAGVPVSVDPNLRLSLWKSEAEAKEAMALVMARADILKISDYEVEFLCGEGDLREGALTLYRTYRPRLMFVTCGAEGAFAIKDGRVISHPGYTVKVADTTGSGDSFCAAALSCLLDKGLDVESLTEGDVLELLRYANAAGALTATGIGAIPSLPRAEAIQALVNAGE